jgi:hypothetical protein
MEVAFEKYLAVPRHDSDVGMHVRKSISNYFEGEHFH